MTQGHRHDLGLTPVDRHDHDGLDTADTRHGGGTTTAGTTTTGKGTAPATPTG